MSISVNDHIEKAKIFYSNLPKRNHIISTVD